MIDPASALQGRTRETKIRRDAEGRWFNDEVEVTHPLLKQAFDRWLVRAPDGSGRFCLSNDINWAYVALEGAPRFVRQVRIRSAVSDGMPTPVEARSAGAGVGSPSRSGATRVVDGATILLALSDESEVALDPDTLRQGPDGALYCTVPGELVARFDRHAMMQLAAITDEDAEGVYLAVGGRAVRPPLVDDPLVALPQCG